MDYGDEMDDEESKARVFQICLVGYLILELGNDILRMLGVDQPVNDLGVFFRYGPWKELTLI